MSQQGQRQDEQEQRPKDERSANDRGGFLQNQQSTANPNYVFGWRGQGGTRTEFRDSLARETANSSTCLAKEVNWGANEYNKFELGRQQKLELVFG